MSFSQKQHKDNLEDWSSSVEFRKKGVTSYGFRPKEGQGKWSHITALMPYGNCLWISQRCYDKANFYTLDKNFNLEHRKIIDRRDQWARAYHRETNKIILGDHIISGEEITKMTQTVSDEQTPPASACRCPSTIDDPSKYMVEADYSGGIHKVNMETAEATFLVRTATGRAHPNKLSQIGDYVIMPGADWKDYGLWKYDGTDLTKIFDEPYVSTYSGPYESNQCLWAIGFDAKSSILRYTEDGDVWKTFRLPKHRPEKETEHIFFGIRDLEGLGVVADIHGAFYLLPSSISSTFGTTKDFVITPIGESISNYHDFCMFAGLLAMGDSGQKFVERERNEWYGQPWAGLNFFRPSKLWSWGKPKGYGGVWKNTSVSAGETSDPFLINGFDQKTIHLETDAATDYTIQVDPIGDGSWKDYDTVSFSGSGYDTYIMTGDAVWARIKSSDAVTATAWLNLS